MNSLNAKAALDAIYRGPDHVQRAPPVQDLVRAWRAAAPLAPESAIDWWKSRRIMGRRLRQHVPVEEAARLFQRIPPESVVRRLGRVYDHLEEVAGRLLPPSAVEGIWAKGFDSSYDALVAYGEPDPLGLALRRHLEPATLLATWNQEAADSLADAMDLWEDRGILGRELRRLTKPTTFRRLWREIAADNDWWAARLLESAPTRVQNDLNALDLAPLALSEDEPVRSTALQYLQEMINNGLPAPRRPLDFIQQWRRVAQGNSLWAATLILAVPGTVRAHLTPTDLADLLTCEDPGVREAVVSRLPELSGH